MATFKTNRVQQPRNNLELMPPTGFGRGRPNQSQNKAKGGYQQIYAKRNTSEMQAQTTSGPFRYNNQNPGEKQRGMVSTPHGYLNNTKLCAQSSAPFDRGGGYGRTTSMGKSGGQQPINTSFNTNDRPGPPYSRDHWQHHSYDSQQQFVQHNNFSHVDPRLGRYTGVMAAPSSSDCPMSSPYFNPGYPPFPDQPMDPAPYQGPASYIMGPGGDNSNSWRPGFGQQTSQITETPKQQMPTQKQAKKRSASETNDSSLHIITCNVRGLQIWSKFKDDVPMLFEVYGYLDSAISRNILTGGSKEFLIRDEGKASIKCIFYEIDRPLPKMTRGQWQRCVGNIDKKSGMLKCVSIRPASDAERQLSSALYIQSNKAMVDLTHNLNEP